MPIPIGTPDPSQVLQKQLGVKGKFDLRLDETIVPVATVTDCRNSPFEQGVYNFMGQKQLAPAAGRFAYIMARPVVGVIIAIDAFSFDNEFQADNPYLIDLRIMAPANIAAITELSSDAMLNTSDPIQATDLVQGAAAEVVSLDHNTANVGGLLDRYSFTDAAFTGPHHHRVPLANPIFLNGDADGGIGGLALVNRTAQSALRGSFEGRVFTSRG